MNWKTKDSTYIVNDRWLQLRADTCETLEGVEITPYYVFEYPNWVSVVVIDDQGMTWILDQYRHGVGSVVREIVAGAIEGDETPEQAARREVREELGYEGGECIELGKGYANPANQTNTVYFMLIQGGSVTRDQELEVGETLVAHATPWEDFIQEVHQGTTTYQSLHLSAILLAERYLNSIVIMPHSTSNTFFAQRLLDTLEDTQGSVVAWESQIESAKVGFDFTTPEEAFSRLEEEIGEVVEAESELLEHGRAEHYHDELCDVQFGVMNVLRQSGYGSEDISEVFQDQSHIHSDDISIDCFLSAWQAFQSSFQKQSDQDMPITGKELVQTCSRLIIQTGGDPEQTAQKNVTKYLKRCLYIETALKKRKITWTDIELSEIYQLWKQAKNAGY